MSSRDTKNNSFSQNHSDNKDKENTKSSNNTDSDIPVQNVNNGNNNNSNATSTSHFDNNANNTNKGSQPSNDESTKTPEGSLVIDDINMKNSLLKEINRIDNWSNVASDNGLFDTNQNKDKKFFEEIQERIRDARKRLYANELPEADYEASKALRLYNKALYNVSRKWRFANVYGAPMFLYLIGFMVAVLVFYWFAADKNVTTWHVQIQKDALYAATGVLLEEFYEGYGFSKIG